MNEADKILIGRAEQVVLPDISDKPVHARIDTGARTSSIWASKVSLENGKLRVEFFEENTQKGIHAVLYFDHFEKTMVASSMGNMQSRYKVKLTIKLANKKIKAWFTLADRSTQVYPVLIGRNVLRGKFIVDVKQGSILGREEKARTAWLKSQLKIESED